YRSHNAHELEMPADKFQTTNNDSDIAAEPSLPHRVADHRHRSVWTATPHIVGGREGPADDGGNTKSGKEGTARNHSPHRLDRSTGREVERRPRPCEGVLER